MRTRRAALMWAGCSAAAALMLLAAAWLSGGGDPGEDEVDTHCFGDGRPGDFSEEPRAGSIFFHETSCRSSSSGRLELGPRQACAVESAARSNPSLDVYLLFASPLPLNHSSWSWAARELLAYPNVHIRSLNVERYLRGTPLEDLYTSGALHKSYWPVSHTSDVLRFLTLWKYGGTYMDLDIVLTKSLEGLHNFAGAESSANVAVGVINLGSDGLGRRVAEACIQDIRNNFRGDKWGHNGPGVMTRVLQRLCGVHKAIEMTPAKCSGFTVYPPTTFYPVPWVQWKLYFDESSSASTMDMLRNSVAIHVWNKFSKGSEITFGSSQPYGLIAQAYCPRVYVRSAPVF